MKALKKHMDVKWIILYVQRWLTAPFQMPNGELIERTAGLPQGGSPILANLFMHYAFDHWMTKNHPENPWDRYADDALIHCKSLKDAQELLSDLKERLGICHLEIHPDKTHIVYCKDDNRTADHVHTSFDFLGYTFRQRTVKTKTSQYFNGFNPAVSKKAAQGLRDRLKEIRYRKGINQIEDLAALMNPIIRGWANYFTQFSAGEAKNILSKVNLTLVRWAIRTKKSLRRHPARALDWLGIVAQTRPDLFAHWQMGITPATG